MAVKEKYPFSAAAGGSIENIETDVEKVRGMINAAKVAASEGGKKKKRSKKGGKGTGAGVLSEMVPYLNPELAQEVMTQHNIPPDDILEESAAESLILAAQAAKEMVQGLDRLEEMPGYIFY